MGDVIGMPKRVRHRFSFWTGIVLEERDGWATILWEDDMYMKTKGRKSNRFAHELSEFEVLK